MRKQGAYNQNPRGPKLPKKYWAKGKSKHLFIRLDQEKVNNINQLKETNGN